MPCSFRILFFIGIISFTNLSYAENCQSLLKPLSHDMQAIQQQLQASDNQTSYKESVSLRYGQVDDWLNKFMHCSDNKASEKELRNAQKIRTLLASLQASAKASAFTKFSDWLKAKELDSQLCQQLLSINPVLAQAASDETQ